MSAPTTGDSSIVSELVHSVQTTYAPTGTSYSLLLKTPNRAGTVATTAKLQEAGTKEEPWPKTLITRRDTTPQSALKALFHAATASGDKVFLWKKVEPLWEKQRTFVEQHEAALSEYRTS